MEALFPKSARKQMSWSKNSYKPSKNIQKIFADLFVDTGADQIGGKEKINMERCPWCLGNEKMIRYHDEEWGCTGV